jgi:hypothetical protein
VSEHKIEANSRTHLDEGDNNISSPNEAEALDAGFMENADAQERRPLRDVVVEIMENWFKHAKDCEIRLRKAWANGRKTYLLAEGNALNRWWCDAQERWSANLAAFLEDARAEPPLSDAQRSLMEWWFIHVHHVPKSLSKGTDLLQAVYEAQYDLLRTGHQPSLYMLRMMTSELRLFRERLGQPKKLSKPEIGDFLFHGIATALQMEGVPKKKAQAQAVKEVARVQNLSDVRSIYRRRTRSKKPGKRRPKPPE